MVHGAWYTVRGIRYTVVVRMVPANGHMNIRMVHGSWHMVRGRLCMVHGSWYIVHGTWCIVHGYTRYTLYATWWWYKWYQQTVTLTYERCAVHGIWYMVHGYAWYTAIGIYMVVVRRRSTNGRMNSEL